MQRIFSEQICRHYSTLITVNNGQAVFGSEILDKLPAVFQPEKYAAAHSSRFAEQGITPREMEIIEWAAKGLNNKEIANRLFLSEGTIRNQISNILEKLDLRDRTQLVAYYYGGDIGK